jgi:hypothetical protein
MKLRERLVKSMQQYADLNGDGKIDKQDVTFAVHLAVTEAEEHANRAPLKAGVVCAALSAVLTSILWAIFC